MATAGLRRTWVQCTQCGRISYIDESVPIDKLYVKTTCEKCGNAKAINCGSKKEDIVLYYDPYLDERWFRY